ncbi:Hypothetical predicted protein [Octopus vulgaris]|uniref:Uncharacterized protein n=1 Tax=Octopus vulgaris TaxID=6645 RepID=A0AA36AIA4_OCTVU|nr:Hypothetical predicted protein [Octopus vulgaris]
MPTVLPCRHGKTLLATMKKQRQKLPITIFLKKASHEDTTSPKTPEEASPEEASPEEASPEEASPEEASPEEASPEEASPEEL